MQRVAACLSELGHEPVWLSGDAHTAPQAAAALGVQLGQIAKSIVFRRRADDAAVLVIASGDRRVDESKVAQLVGPVGRADAAFVKASTGFSIGGVSPVGHLQPPVLLLDQDLFRFDVVWAAAGHPRSVFAVSPAELARITGAQAQDVALLPAV